MDNQFESKGGGQNVGQGDHAIGKRVNVTQKVRGDGNIFSGTGNVTVNGIPPALFAEYAGKLAVTDSALASFFKILEEQQVPRSDLDSKLREIAATHKELLLRMETVQSTDPQVVRLKDEARQAIEAGDYAKAEDLLNQAEARDVQAIEQLEDAARQRRVSAADTNVTQALAQRIQLRYAKAAAYWQKAAALLPEESKKDRAKYLGEAGNDLHRIAKYKEALPLYEQSLRIRQEIGDKNQEGTTLNNIAAIHHAKGDYDKALPLWEQSLRIMQELGDKAGEGTTLNNISQIYDARGDYTTALKYLEQSLVLFREIGDKAHEGGTLNNIAAIHHAKGDYDKALPLWEQSLRITQEIGDKKQEGTTLNNISQIYRARGDYPTALKYLEQSLAIRQEIGDRRGEAETSWNIGLAYIKQGDLRKAEPYISRAVQLAEEIGYPLLEEWRKGLARVRAKLLGR